MVLGPIRPDGSYDRMKVEFEIARLESLLADLRRVLADGPPLPADIAESPRIDIWALDTIPLPCLRGHVTGHPTARLNARGVTTRTTDLWVLDGVRGIARTMNRWYRLGTEASRWGSLQ
jgi:hypothetical protein